MQTKQIKTFSFPKLSLSTLFSRLPIKQKKYWIHNEEQSILALTADSSWNAYTKQDIEESHLFFKENGNNLILALYSYDLAYSLLNVTCQRTQTDPLLCLRSFSQFLHEEKGGVTLYYHDPSLLQYVQETLTKEPYQEEVELTWEPTLSYDSYKTAFHNIQNDITNGLFYQLNYTQQYKAKIKGSASSVFLRLLKQNVAPYASFWEDDDLAIVSLSPESFLAVNQGYIRTKPIKGSIARNTPQAFRRLWLNEKEQAELYMITDLMRNDLSIIAKTGTVKVLSQRKAQLLSKIIHTYSIIECKHKENLSIHEMILALLPAGSISGCPKKQAVTSIQAYENYNRSFYTGIMGYVLPSQKAHFNILIRTLIQNKQETTISVGGGITNMSKSKQEYQECIDKLSSLKIV